MNDPDPTDMTPASRKAVGAMGAQADAGRTGGDGRQSPVGAASSTTSSTASSTASSIADDAKRRADDVLSTGLERGADDLKSVAGAVEDASKRIREESPDSVAAQLSDYCVVAARKASEFAEGLRGRSLDDLASDLRGVARNNPAVFVAGSIAVGFALSRFLRASSAPSTQRLAGNGSANPNRVAGQRSTEGRSFGDRSFEDRSAEDSSYESRSIGNYGGTP